MLVDASNMLSSVDENSLFHSRAREWLTEASADSDFVRFPAVTWFNPLLH